MKVLANNPYISVKTTFRVIFRNRNIISLSFIDIDFVKVGYI